MQERGNKAEVCADGAREWGGGRRRTVVDYTRYGQIVDKPSEKENATVVNSASTGDTEMHFSRADTGARGRSFTRFSHILFDFTVSYYRTSITTLKPLTAC